MSCTKHFLNFEWQHHHWRKQVTFAENRAKQETNMWGRPVKGAYTHCIKHDVCDVCGQTRESANCLCDCDVGDQCAIRLAWIDEARKAAL